jgi:hypothetical protein
MARCTGAPYVSDCADCFIPTLHIFTETSASGQDARAVGEVSSLMLVLNRARIVGLSYRIGVATARNFLYDSGIE